ncbi:gliding motility protein GldN, partial [Hymenobacter defluvii]|nr:gliding motility protein GldN [Hymenobacter defluvii]
SKTIWRAVDLREKQNKPMFAEGKEISRIILDAVKRGELQAYANDSLTRTLTPAQVQANASYVEETQGLTDAEKAAGFTDA